MGLPTSEPRLPLPGETINGKYRIVRKLGEGGMGIVYEAIHIRLRQQVAIKMLLPRVLSVGDAVARFEREARAAGQMRSPNVARVIDVDVTPEGLPCMVMEFLEGHDLSAELMKRGALPIDEAVDYLLQTCAAMDEAHALGIIHRDLKPSNLFVCEANGRRVIKVLDFGISKITTEEDDRVTRTQSSFGTPLYMSPEQIRSAKHVDFRSDIWALGVILYELVAGLPPFVGNTTAAAASIVADEPPPLKGVRQDLPEGLEETILKALSKDPDNRFGDVRAFAAALAAFARPSASRWALQPISSRRLPFASMDRPSGRSIANDETVMATEQNDPRARSPGSGNPQVTGGAWTTGSGGTHSVIPGRARRRMAAALGAGAGLLLASVAALAWVGTRPPGISKPVSAGAGVAVESRKEASSGGEELPHTASAIKPVVLPTERTSPHAGGSARAAAGHPKQASEKSAKMAPTASPANPTYSPPVPPAPPPASPPVVTATNPLHL